MPSLREMRAGRVLTVRALAERAGVSTRTIVLIEGQKSVPTFHTIQCLSRALAVEPTEVDEFRAAIQAAGQAPRHNRKSQR